MNSFSETSSYMEDRQKIIQYVKISLQNKVFIGQYTERRLIEPLCAYKDVIEVDQKDGEFFETLHSVNEKLKNGFSKKFVSCVQGTKTEGYSILTDLSGCAFGSYWFMVKNIVVNELTMIISVKCLRSYNVEKDLSTVTSFKDFWNNFDLMPFVTNIALFLTEILTKENFVLAFRFLTALFLSIAVGIYHLLELCLKFARELNDTIRALTPIILAMIDALSKAFGGLLILITYMWKGGSSNGPRNDQYLQYKASNQYLQYPSYKNSMNDGIQNYRNNRYISGKNNNNPY